MNRKRPTRRHHAIVRYAFAVIACSATAHVAASQQAAFGTEPVLDLKGVGVQVYTCDRVGDAWQWHFKAPEAKLLDAAGKVVGQHAAGPTWKLYDGSAVTAKMLTSTPHPEGVAWLTLAVTANSGKGRLSTATAIQRTETVGGLPPLTGCDAQHAGEETRVSYTARYTFYSGAVPATETR